jgi:hypothetical protein
VEPGGSAPPLILAANTLRLYMHVLALLARL